MERKVISIATTSPSFSPFGNYISSQLMALCDDGSVFHMDFGYGKWNKLPDIPQD